MGIDHRPATCASCGKRLTRKSWYYRNGQYFCKARCWETFRDKAAAEAAEAQAKASEAKAEAPAAETPAAESPAAPTEDKPAG